MIFKKANKIVFLTLALSLFCINVNAQYNSEEELKKAADEFFLAKDYVKSLPLYSQLLSLYPKDPNYNYKYGTSFFFAKREKDDALKFLKFAASKPNVDPVAYYYLGLVNHHNYQFSAAEANYKKFKEKASSKDIAEFDVDRNIEMCKNGLRLLKSMTDIGVLYKKEIKESEFFRSYDLKGIGGKIIVKPDEFKTKLDLKKNETSLIHLGDKPKMVIFSSYGNDGKTGKDIYRVVRLPNGEWSKPASIGDGINSNFDEDYPFLHPDGRTLYFSSKGYNSMGGYDIFKSELNPETGQWSYPENLDFPINTPDDDILFISDIDNELAFFASSRASMQGELTVYKVQVDAKPAENSIVKGMFLAESNPSMKSATISVMDAEKERTYGIYTTNNENGDYLLVFPSNGGKYKILVETTDNSPIHSAIIELPVLEGFRALKQELRLVGEGDSEKLVVKNLFDESDEFDMTDPLVVENLLKMKAKLDVNTTEEELLANKSSQPKIEKTLSEFLDLSDEELTSTATTKSDKILEKSRKSRNQANYAYQLANVKSKKAKELFAQAQQLENEASVSTDEGAKQQKLIEAKKVKNQAAKNVNETIAALSLAKAIDGEAIERESDVEEVKKLKEEIANDISSGNRSGAEEKYAKLNEISEAAYHNQSVINTEKEFNENKLTEKQAEYNKARNEVLELSNREKEIEGTINSTETTLASTSKKNEKADLESQINALKIDLEDVKYDLGVAKKKEEKLKEEYTSVKNNSETTEKVIETVSSSNSNQNVGKVDQLAISNDIVFFEKEGLVGLYPEENEGSNTEEVSSEQIQETFDLKDYKDDYSIITDDGKIKDYNVEYGSALVDAENTTDERQKSLQLAKINQDWANSIDEEVSILKKQAESSDNLNEKVQIKSKIEKLNNLKEEKQKQANVQLLVAETLTNTEEQTAENTSEVNTKTENNNSINNNNTNSNENVNVVSNQGDIVDYDKKYAQELEAIGNADSKDNIARKVEVYNNWSNAIEQEILLEKVALENASEEDKESINNNISVLEAKLENNNEIVADLNETEANNVSITETNSSSVVNPANYSKEVVAENGEVLDYSSKFRNELAESSNIEEVKANWINAIDEEINYREEQIKATSDEDEQNVFKARIDELKELKSSEELMAQNKEVVASSENNSTIVNENNNEKPKATYVNLEDDPTVYNSSEKDNQLNVNYNSDYKYNSNQSKIELKSVNQLKDEAIALYKEADEKTISLTSIDNVSEREKVIAEINVLKEQAQKKEISVAKQYGKSNKSEFYNNQEVLSKVKAKSNKDANNSTIADMLVDESNTYFEQALEERNKAENATTFTAKEMSLQKAYNLELQALAKQSNAINLYGENQDVTEVYAQVNSQPTKSVTNNVSSTNPSNNNESPETVVESVNDKNTKPTIIQNNSNQIIATEKINKKLNEEPVYEPLALSLPSDVEKQKGDALISEAEKLEKEAVVLTDSANVLEKKKEKDALLAEAKSLTEKASQKRSEAQVIYTNASELQKDETQLKDDLQSNRSNVSNESFTESDNKALALLTKDELNQISESEDYKNYAEAKQSSRRLVKEAEVDYIQADKFQQEAEDEKTLGISLKALAAGAKGDAKAKLEGQLQKLEKMIAENESKANEARKNATEKELKALRLTKEAEVILVNNKTESDKIVAIEKANTFDAELLAIVSSTARTTSGETNNELTQEKNMNEASEEIATIEDNNSSQSENAIEENIVEENSSINEIVATNENTTPIENVEESVINESVNEDTTEVLSSTESTNSVNTTNISENVIEEENASEELVSKESTTPSENVVTEENNEETVNETTEEIATIENNNFTENVQSEQATTNNQVVTTNVNDVPKQLTSPIFVFNGNNKSEYNANNPIPGVEKLPEGLVFKVQIGAFRNPIPQDHFKGFAPIMVEDAGNGIKRYTAGFFKTINMAVEAKNSIKSIGYEDAFVVAFYNGKRISINEARAKLGNTQAQVETIASTTSQSNSSTSNQIENNNSSTSSKPSVPKVATNYEEVKDGVSTDVHKIEGVFFTIQVGVYSKPVTADQLSNVTPLNSERTANGLIRYTSGVYKSIEVANTAKDRVRSLGIADAFVIAYANGNRIKVSEAIEFLNTNENTSNNSSSENNSNKSSSENNSITTNNTSSSNTSIPVSNNKEVNNTTTETVEEKQPIDQVKVGQELNIIFKVKLGEYEDDIPVDEAGVYLGLTNKGLEIKEENGKSVYSIGAYPDYSSALDKQIEMKDAGIRKPTIIAFKDGTKIDVEEALELVKNSN